MFTCKKCGIEKPDSAFRPHKTTMIGHLHSCRECINARRRGQKNDPFRYMYGSKIDPVEIDRTIPPLTRPLPDFFWKKKYKKAADNKKKLTRAILDDTFKYDPLTGKMSYKPENISFRTKTKGGYSYQIKGGGRFLASHIICFIITGGLPLKQVIHTDGDLYNLKLDNLVFNKITTISGYLGVGANRGRNKARDMRYYPVYSYVDKKDAVIKRKGLGVFTKAWDAAKAYNQAAVNDQGEGATVNLPDNQIVKFGTLSKKVRDTIV